MNRIDDKLVHNGANEELIHTFMSESVEFLIVGGLAVSWYCSNRLADDMDLLINPTNENSKRVCNALRKLGLPVPSSSSFAKHSVKASLKHHHYADLLTPKEKGLSYQKIAEGAVNAKLFGFSVKVASVTSLIYLKEQAILSDEQGKEKHLNDIASLKANTPALG